jgi:hypothetical protein
MSLERDLQNLRSVVEVVITETPRTSQRVRLLSPWVGCVRRRGASWRQLVPVLAPICSLADEIKTETRLSQIFAVAEKRRPKSAVDYDAWRGAVSEAAGVELPVTGRPVDNGSIVVPARLVGLLEKMAEGLRPATGSRLGAPMSAASAGPINQPRPSQGLPTSSRSGEPSPGSFTLTPGASGGDKPTPLNLGSTTAKVGISDVEARQLAEAGLKAAEDNKIAVRKAAMEARRTGFLTSPTTSMTSGEGTGQ